MKPRLAQAFSILALWLMPTLAFAGVEQISEAEFRALAEELAPKVNLFKAGWEKDPQAEFYGGTTRDYLYWLKGKFLNAHSKAEASRIVKDLKAIPMIDVRDFIIGDSDVDMISTNGASLDAKQFGVRKIDTQTPDILDPSTELGQNELLQGHIPAEKIRLGRDGVRSSEGLGNGLKEIYTGRLSVHFTSPEEFARSKFAREGINHPILLALRYLRVQAINYFRTHGPGFPDGQKLLSGADEGSVRKVREVIDASLQPGELEPFLSKEKFKSWLNGAIQKSFRSYTNPTAALELMREFKITRFPELYPKEVETLNQYVFSQFRDEKAIEAAMSELKVDESKFYESPQAHFPDGNLYHGTKTEEAFRGILFQGILPSEGGSAGAGLYGVNEDNISISERFAGDKNRLLRFEVKKGTKIVDITQGEGKRVFDSANLSFDEFSRRFGIDILLYPYGEKGAFVVKNADMVGKAEGVYRKMMPLSELLKIAPKWKKTEELFEAASANSLTTDEIDLLWKASSVSAKEAAAKLGNASTPKALTELLLTPYWQKKPEIRQTILQHLRQAPSELSQEMLKAIARNPSLEPEHARFLNSLFVDEDILRSPEHARSLLSFFRAHPFPLPAATKLAVEAFEKYQAEATAYLTQSKPDAKGTKVVLAGYEKLLAKGAEGSQLTPFESFLLKSGHHLDLVKEELIKRASPLNNSYAINALATLGKHFPKEPKAVDIFLKLAAWKFQLSPSEWGSFPGLAPYFAHDPRVRRFFFDQMRVSKGDHLLLSYSLLAGAPLKLEEAVELLETTFLLNENGMNLTLRLIENMPELGADATRYKLNLLLRSKGVPPPGLIQSIRQDGRPELVRDYVTRLLRSEAPSASPADLSAAHWDKVILTKNLIQENLFEPNEDFTRAALTYLDKSGPSELRSMRPLIQFLPIEQPEVSLQVQKILARGGIHALEPQDLKNIFSRITNPNPEFSALIKEFAQKEREEALAHSRIATDCQGSYGALTQALGSPSH